MPKKRVSKGRTAKQKAASRRNLEKARAAKRDRTLPFSVANDMSKPKGVRDAAYHTGYKPYPTGKRTFLYHRTIPQAADKIVKTKTWKSGAKAMGGVPGHSQFTIGQPLERFVHANALVGVAVPRKKVRKVQHEGKGVFAVVVKNSDLKGRRVRRLK